MGIVSQLGLNPAVAQAALVAPDGKVIAATRFAWKGRTAAEHLPGYPKTPCGRFAGRSVSS